MVGTTLGLLSCGTFGKDLVLVYEIVGKGRDGILIVSLDADRREKWRLELPNHRLTGQEAQRATADIPMHGSLARFELVERFDDEGSTVAAVLIDLEIGAVAGELPAPKIAPVFRIGTRHFLRFGEANEFSIIVVVDGQSGKLLGARRYAVGPSRFDYSQVNGDVMWLNAFSVYTDLETTAWVTLRLQDGLPVIYQNGDTEAPVVPLAIVR